MRQLVTIMGWMYMYPDQIWPMRLSVLVARTNGARGSRQTTRTHVPEEADGRGPPAYYRVLCLIFCMCLCPCSCSIISVFLPLYPRIRSRVWLFKCSSLSFPSFSGDLVPFRALMHQHLRLLEMTVWSRVFNAFAVVACLFSMDRSSSLASLP